MEKEKYLVQESDANLIDLRKILDLIRKEFRFILVSFVVVAAILIFVTLQLKPYFRIKIPISSYVLVSNQLVPLVDGLSQILQNQNTNLLSQQLAIPEEDVVNLKAIQLRAPNNSQGYFTAEIEILSYNKEILNQIPDKIIDYLNENPYVANIVAAHREELENLYSEQLKELAQLDSLKQYFLRLAKDPDISKEILISTTELYTSTMELKEKIESTSKDLRLHKGIELMYQPVAPNKPTGPPRLALTALSLGLASLLSLIIAAIKSSL